MTTIAVRTQEETQAPSKLRAAARQFGVVWSNKKARIGIIILGVFVFVAVFAPLLAPYGASQNGFARSADATPDHWMGTTAAGEDVLSQIIYGARISVMVGAVAGILSTLVAVAIGLSWGYVRGWIAEVIGFIVNLFLVIPGLPLMIVIAAYLQNGGIAVIIAVIVVTGWAWGAIVFREILPNMTSLIVGSFFGAATSAILAEAGLEFLGLGDSSIVSWGTILYWAQNSNALLTGQWILLFAPGLCIALLAMSLTLINFGVDAVSNPRLRDGARPRKEKRA
jgi:peptide/nickel transport system permease protein